MPNIFERARAKREAEGEAAVKGGESKDDTPAPAPAKFDFFRVPKTDPEREKAKKEALLKLLRER